jgi:hypothetical protein
LSIWGRWWLWWHLGGFWSHLSCGGRVWLARGRVLAPSAFLRLAASLDVGLSDSTRLASTCAADATLVAAWGVSPARRMGWCWQLGRRSTTGVYGSAWPYLSGCLAEVFIWGPRHRRLSFSSVFTRVFTLTSSSGGERLLCLEGQDGPLPTPSPTCAASPGLG